MGIDFELEGNFLGSISHFMPFGLHFTSRQLGRRSFSFSFKFGYEGADAD